MPSHTKKQREFQTTPSAGHTSQKQVGSKLPIQLMGNKPAAINQKVRQLQSMIATSPQAKQLQTTQHFVSTSPIQRIINFNGKNLSSMKDTAEDGAAWQFYKSLPDDKKELFRDFVSDSEYTIGAASFVPVAVTSYETGVLTQGPVFEHIRFSDGSYWSTKICRTNGKIVYLDIRSGTCAGEGFTVSDSEAYTAQEVKKWLLALHPELKEHWAAYRTAAAKK